MAKPFRTNVNPDELPSDDEEGGLLNLFDQENNDVNLFNMIDEENIRLSGSKIYVFKYYQSDDFDEVYMESRNKPIAKDPIVAYGHYDPIAISEELTQFGIELTNDQLFTFNKSYIERKIGRRLIPGDVVKPAFQNQRYEIFEVVEDSFEAYGVYHLVCSAKLLRDSPDIQDEPITAISDGLGGYAGID